LYNKHRKRIIYIKMKKPQNMILLAVLVVLSAFPAKIYSQSNNSKKEAEMETQQVFIDKFFVPKNAKQEFDERANINRNFIKKIPGFIEDNVYERVDEQGNFIVITTAIWKNADAIKKAKEAVQDEYKKEGFDMQGMLKRLNIIIDRGIYKRETSAVTQKIDTSMLILIDKVFVPASAIKEFNERWNLSRNFIKKQPGFIEDIAYQRTDENNNVSYITFVVWKNKDAFNTAMLAVQAEYKREGFDMQAMLKRTKITIDRGGIFKKETK